jgi:hypothetical protein
VFAKVRTGDLQVRHARSSKQAHVGRKQHPVVLGQAVQRKQRGRVAADMIALLMGIVGDGEPCAPGIAGQPLRDCERIILLGELPDCRDIEFAVTFERPPEYHAGWSERHMQRVIRYPECRRSAPK